MTLRANNVGGVNRVERYERVCGRCDGVGAIAELIGKKCVQYVPCPECWGDALIANSRAVPPPEEEEC